MKRFALSLALAVFVSACNDGGVVGSPAEPTPEETPAPTATPEPQPSATPPLPAEADFAVVLEWDDLGSDWELHLVKPGGQINDSVTDCTWTTCIYTSPDWGLAGNAADDPHKDIDDIDQYGPERVWLGDPEAGTYTILVEHWGSGQADSDGMVTISVGAQDTSVSMTDLPSHFVWTAGTITWPSGAVTTSQEVFDCSASWSAGCTAALP